MKIYVAGPFFTEDERLYLNLMITDIRQNFIGSELFIPMEHFIEDGENLPNYEWAKKVYDMDVQALKEADLIIALYLGHYSDTGTAYELGMARILNKPTFLYIPQEVLNNDMSLMTISGASIVFTNDFKILNINQLNQK